MPAGGEDHVRRGARLIARLRTLHPYEVPEILSLDATASASYGAWLQAETRG